MKENIKTIEEMEKITVELKSQGEKIITTNGSFDVLHIAHVNLLNKAKALGDKLVVLISDDESVGISKGPTRPIVPERERAEMLLSLKVVDYVVIFPKGELLSCLEKIKPDIHVKGSDYNPLDYVSMPESKVIKEYGGKIKIVDLLEGKSTSDIIISLPGKALRVFVMLFIMFYLLN